MTGGCTFARPDGHPCGADAVQSFALDLDDPDTRSWYAEAFPKLPEPPAVPFEIRRCLEHYVDNDPDAP